VAGRGDHKENDDATRHAKAGEGPSPATRRLATGSTQRDDRPKLRFDSATHLNPVTVS